ncbi:HBR552Cp [Eremothecium sinecaudum]|uniref:HBR552Cp n=1 Tax=Eremothecium sinecaudum TaxID=45286 RepID=A0A109UXQ3_9SACH|nr:HBR552Cp [Eremothecium sinecaudum]AMD19453.1 HBR552Cp [Eremothecium sinecaudum]
MKAVGVFFVGLSILQYAYGQIVPAKDYVKRKYFAVESRNNVSAILMEHPNWTFEHNARGLDNHYVFSVGLGDANKRSNVQDELDESVLSYHDLIPERLYKRMPVPGQVDASVEAFRVDIKQKLSIEDPTFNRQWHLMNTLYPGFDLNVTGLWLNNITGKGVVVAVVDDGLDFEGDDLKDNFCAEGSWDFNDNTALPKPQLRDDTHGTRCAAEVAAARNNVCGVGVAYNSKVSGIRILSDDVTVEQEAASLVYGLGVNDIYSCSWGPVDNGAEMQGPSPMVQKALIKGVSEGRDKKGALYVFASGNGGMNGDNCNYDGFTNSIYSITVSAIDHMGAHPPYAESCSAVLVVAYSSGNGEFIHSTGVHNTCSDTHSGTSAAAPLAAGVYALVLEANPNLTWRDVQYLTILSSLEVDEKDSGWQDGALGKRYSHKYGYGRMDAYRIVEAAKTWENVNPQSWFYCPTVKVKKNTKSTENSLESSFTVTEQDLIDANFKRVEHVTVTVNINADVRGHTTVDLISPGGTVSNLGVVRRRDMHSEGFKDWTFMSVAHWGESGKGEWKLVVKTASNANLVELIDWRLKLFGESIDASKAVPFEFGNDDESHITHQRPSPSHSSSSSESSSESPSGSSLSGANMLPTTGHAKTYYFTIFMIGAMVLIFYFIFFSKTRRVRRSRAETFEFDIIDTDSEYDSSVDQSMDNTARILTDNDFNDFTFALSDEEQQANAENPFLSEEDPESKHHAKSSDPLLKDTVEAIEDPVSTTDSNTRQ